jgi:hypothetical protein
MRLKEVLSGNPKILYYPFSCTDFNFLNSLIDVLPFTVKDYLFVYCTIETDDQKSQLVGEQTNMSYYPIEFPENKMGVAGLEIINKSEINDKVKGCYYVYKNGIKLLFVREDAFRFSRLMNSLIDNDSSVNLIIKGCGDFNNVVPLIELYHPKVAASISLDKYMIAENIYIEDIDKHYSFNNPNGFYQSKEHLMPLEFGEFYIYYSSENTKKTLDKISVCNKGLMLM